MVWLGMRCQYFSGGPNKLFIMQALIKEKKFRSSLAQDITEVRKWKNLLTHLIHPLAATILFLPYHILLPAAFSS